RRPHGARRAGARSGPPPPRRLTCDGNHGPVETFGWTAIRHLLSRTGTVETANDGGADPPRTSREASQMTQAPASVTLTANGTTLELPTVQSTEGPSGIVVSSLLGQTGLTTVDPGFMNTSSCESKITYIDGDEGILRYRGYPIEQLAEHSTFLEVAYLLVHGELPSAAELEAFENRVN